MGSIDALLIGGLIALFGLGSIIQARTPYARYSTIAGIMTTAEQKLEPGAEAILRRSVRVAEPATPQRTPPEPLGDDESPAALCAWRVRRLKHTDNEDRDSHWATVDSDLAVGDFTFRHQSEPVQFDDEWVRSTLTEKLTAIEDPDGSPHLYLDAPDVDLPLGERSLLATVLDRLRLTGDGGLLTDWGIHRYVGSSSASPDRYQATKIRDGDELVLRGELATTDNGVILRDTDETPLILTTGEIADKGRRLRSRAFKQSAFGVSLLVLGGVVTFGPLL